MSCMYEPDYSEATWLCTDCGADVNADGESIEQCGYSPVMCTTCDDAPCDGSC